MNRPAHLPHAPGVYQFLKEGQVLYVGKAKDLQHRVSSYFSADAPEKAQRLVAEADTVETTVTSSENEALLLEQSLIQQHRPEFNVMLKEGVRYAYLLLQKHPLRLTTLRRQPGQSVPKGRLFGPFAKGSHRWELIRLLRGLFFRKTGKPLGTHENADAAELIEKVLEGKINIQEELTRLMHEASKNQEYERAGQYKKRLDALDALSERQSIEQKTSAHQDVIGFARDKDALAAQVFRVRFGVLREQEKHRYETLAEDPVEEFLAMYYAAHAPPKEVVIRPVKNPHTTASILPRTQILHPKTGTAAKLLELAEQNAARLLHEKVPEEVVALQKALFLPSLPRRIEGFDISTFQGAQTVGAMVSFYDGKPDKANYRYFNTEKPTQDDFAAMEEVVFRRYDRLRRENQTLPDLILIDGGPGQLSAAQIALERADVRRPIVALAKEFEEIYKTGRTSPVRLDRKDPALKLLQRVRDEVHRFVVGFHRRKRTKEAFQ